MIIFHINPNKNFCRIRLYKSINNSILSRQITKCVFKDIVVDCNHGHNNESFIIKGTTRRKINNKFISLAAILLNTAIESIDINYHLHIDY